MPVVTPILVIGLGNHYRKDDGVGLYVAEKIKSLNIAGVKVIERLSDSSRLLEIWVEAAKAYIIDCSESGAKPGYVRRFDGLKESIPEDYFSRYSTHSLSIVDAIELARTLGELPEDLVVYGIEGKDMSSGEGLSPEVAQAADKVVKQIVREITETKDIE